MPHSPYIACLSSALAAGRMPSEAEVDRAVTAHAALDREAEGAEDWMPPTGEIADRARKLFLAPAREPADLLLPHLAAEALQDVVFYRDTDDGWGRERLLKRGDDALGAARAVIESFAARGLRIVRESTP